MANSSKSRHKRDDPQRRRCPFLVPVLAVLSFLVFIITMLVNNCPQHVSNCTLRFLGRLSFQPMSENPLLGPSSSTLTKMGGLSSDLVVQNHQIWRLFTCLWLHAGLIHLLVNVLSLLFVGTRLEQEFGPGRVGIIYLLSGIGGSLLAAIFLHHQITAGASASLFGCLGAMLSTLIINYSLPTLKCATLTTVALIATVNLAIGIMPHADNFAHIGGFIFGFFLGCALLIRPQRGWGDQTIVPGPKPSVTFTSKYTPVQIVLWIGAIILLLVGYVVCGVLTFRSVDGNDNCDWCHYLNCVPTPLWNCNGGSSRATCKYLISGNYMFMRCEANQRTQLYNGFFQASILKQLCAKLCS